MLTLGVDEAEAATHLTIWGEGNSVVRPEDFGAVGDGLADDTSALQMALDAVRAQPKKLDSEANVGGTVLLQRAYAWKGPLYVREGTFLVGASPRGGGADAQPHLKALPGASPTQLVVGQWSGAKENAGGLANLLIDGNGVGPTARDDGLVRVEAVWATCKDVLIQNAAGTAWFLDGAQNNAFIACHVANSGGAWVLDRGAGGNAWLNCHATENRFGVWLTDLNLADTNAYKFGPGDNNFWNCVFENRVTDTEFVVMADAGNRNKFTQCRFVAASDVVASSALVNVTFDSRLTDNVHLELGSCQFVGGSAQPHAIRISGGHTVVVDGVTHVERTPVAFVQDGSTVGVGTLRLGGQVDGREGVGSLFGTINGGSTATWVVERSMGHAIVASELLSGPALSTQREGDTDSRFRVEGSGAHDWSPGEGTMPISTLMIDESGEHLALNGGLMVAGRIGATPGRIDLAAPAAIEIDSKAHSAYTIKLTATGSVASMVVSNPAAGATLLLMIHPNASGQSVNWAWDMKFADDAQPVVVANRWLVVEFIRRGERWMELSRSLTK